MHIPAKTDRHCMQPIQPALSYKLMSYWKERTRLDAFLCLRIAAANNCTSNDRFLLVV